MSHGPRHLSEGAHRFRKRLLSPSNNDDGGTGSSGNKNPLPDSSSSSSSNTNNFSPSCASCNNAMLMDSPSSSGSSSSASNGAGDSSSGQSGDQGGSSNSGNSNSNNGNNGGQAAAPPQSSSSSSSLAPTSTSSAPPPQQTTSSSATPTRTREAQSSSSTAAPATTAAASTTSHSASAATSTVPPTLSTDTNLGVVVTVTGTGNVAQSTGTGLAGQSGAEEGSSVNIGAVIGGIAGGLCGIIVLVWLILLPVRARAKKQREVDWLDFKPDHHQEDVDGNHSIFRSPHIGAGTGEDDELNTVVASSVVGGGLKRGESVAAGSVLSHGGAHEAYQMHEVAPGLMGGTLYSHLDPVSGEPQQAPGYDANYDPNYAAYYNQSQQQQQYAPGSVVAQYSPYSPQTSPQAGPMVYRGASMRPPQQPQDQAYQAPPYGQGGGGYGSMLPQSPGYAYAYGDAGTPAQPSYQGQPSGESIAGAAVPFPPSDRNAPGQASGGVAVERNGSASSTAQNGGNPTLHRKKKTLDTSDDYQLPYDRRSPSVSEMQGNSANLHLANPDDR